MMSKYFARIVYDDIVSNKEIYEAYEDIYFVEADFFQSRKLYAMQEVTQ